MKPVIGISVECRRDADDLRSGGTLSLNWNYAEAVAEAGGVPLLIPPSADMEAVAKLLDGWIIPGGADIDAARFGEENHPAVELQDPTRYAAEHRLFEAIASDLPVLGICYGCQFLNVAFGGNLVQHLPDVVGNNGHSGGTLQEYGIDADSRLAEMAGTTRMTGKSYHHQAVGRVAPSLRVVATHPDGTVEAVESVERPWLIGVQWHPERTLDDEATRRLFRSFVESAADYAARKAAS